MKIAGKTIALESEFVAIPRPDGKIIIECQPVVDYDEFDKLCPLPKPPLIVKREGKEEEDRSDKDFIEAVNVYSDRKTKWMILKSLEPSNIEWDTVDTKNPDTWSNITEELENSVGNAIATKIINAIFTACGLNLNKIEQATESFLAERAAKAKQ